MFSKMYATSTIWGLFCITLSSSTASEPLYLTPLVKQGRIQEARSLSAVNPSLFLNVTSHSGLLTVNEEYNSNLFFWYFPVPDKPLNETAWIIWLQGGPGSTSLVGLFDEMGPFEYLNNSLTMRKWAWTSKYSMVFIDNPVGVGFSFTDSVYGFASSSDMYTNDLYSALKQLIRIYPELRRAPLYIAGESYAGHYVPELAWKVMENAADDVCNLQGLIMGNPVIDRESISDYISAFYAWGLIDKQGAIAARPLQDKYRAAIANDDPELAYQYRDTLLNLLQSISLQYQLYNVNKDIGDVEGFRNLIENSTIKEALHVGSVQFAYTNRTSADNLVKEFINGGLVSKVEQLLERYRILIYCGQLDLTTPCAEAAEGRRRKWTWSGRAQFLGLPRYPWAHGNYRHAGFVKSGGNFTEVLVRDAGHLVPRDKPAEAFDIIDSFIRDKALPMMPDFVIRAPNTPDYKPDNTPSNSFYTSIVFNVILSVIIIAGLIFFIYYRRENGARMSRAELWNVDI